MQYHKADSLYSIAATHEPRNAEIWWKLARLEVSLGESLRHDRTRNGLRITGKRLCMLAEA